MKTTYLLDFKVDQVPFMLFFDVLLHASAELYMSEQAELSPGVDASMGLGEVAITWDPANHWHHTDDEPSPRRRWRRRHRSTSRGTSR